MCLDAVKTIEEGIQITLHVNIEKDMTGVYLPTIFKCKCIPHTADIKQNASEATITGAIEKERQPIA